jgi:hypothetical protein
MSIEAQDKFAARFAKDGPNWDRWGFTADEVNHAFQDWLYAWIDENKHKGLEEKYTLFPYSEVLVREMFGKFLSLLNEKKNISFSEKVQEEAIQEYLLD